MEAWVWLNGSFVGRHIGHLTPFELDLASALRPGEKNELIIAVSNTRTDRIGCSIRGYKGKSAGITRPVNLLVTSKARIDDFYVHADSSLEGLSWHVKTQGNDLDAPLWIDWEISDPVGGSSLAGGTQPASGAETRWQTGTFEMEPWSDRNPRLYKLTSPFAAKVGCWTLRSIASACGFCRRMATGCCSTIRLFS